MNCTLTFNINGVPYIIENVPLENLQDKDISGATFLDTLYEAVDSADLAIFARVLEDSLVLKAKQPYELDTEISVKDLMNSTLVPNTTNLEIHKAVSEFQSGKKEDQILIRIIKSLLPIEGAKVSLLSKSILIPAERNRIGTAQGFYDRNTGHIYMTISPNDSFFKRTHLEILAHELIHSELSKAVATEGNIIRNMLQVVVEDLKKFKFVVNSTTPEHIRKSAELTKLILSKSGNLQLEELLAYFLTDIHLQTFLTDTGMLSVDFLMSQIDKENTEILTDITIRHAEEAPVIKEKNAEAKKAIAEGLTTNVSITEDLLQEILTEFTPLGPVENSAAYTVAIRQGNNLLIGDYVRNMGTHYMVWSGGDRIEFPLDTVILTDHIDNTPFKGESYETLDMVETLPDSFDKDKQAEIATIVRERFDANKETAEYNTFDINYGDRVDLYETDGDKQYSLTTKNLQVANLKQNDLVLMPQNLSYSKEKKQWFIDKKADKKYLDRFSYRPIVGIFIRESDGEVMVRVPSSDGKKIFSIPAEFVQAYRKYQGDLKIETLYTPEINEMIANRKEELRAIFEFTKLGEAKEKETNAEIQERLDREDLVAEYGITEENAPLKMITWNNKEWTIASNYQSIGYSFTDPEYARSIYNGIKAGDIVRAKIIKKGKKEGSFRAIVTRVFGNSIEIATADPDKKPIIVTLDKLTEIIYRNENHPEVTALLEENPVEDLYYESYDKNNKQRLSISDEFNVHDFTNVKTVDGKRVEFTPEYYQLPPETDFKKLTKEQKEDYIKIQEQQLNKKRYYTSKLKPGDLVKISWNIKGNRSSGWYPVIGSTKNVIFFYSYNKETGKRSIQKVNIKDSYETSEKSVSRIAYNNTKDAELFNWFEGIRSKYAEVFEEDKTKWASNMGEALKSGQALGLEEDFYISSFDTTDITDEESLRQIELEKFRQVTQISRGDIIAKDLGDGRYKWTVVTDIAENGLPIVVTYSKEYEKQFKSGKKFTTKAGYKVYPLSLDQILYIGRNTKIEPSLGIVGNQTLMNELRDIKETLVHFNDPIIFDDLASAKKSGYLKWSNVGKNDIKGKLAEAQSADDDNPNIKEAVYGIKNGVKMWAISEGFLDSVLEPPKGEQKYFIVSDYGLYFSTHLGKFETLYNTKKIADPKKLHEELEPGDVIVETWDYNGKPVYMNSIIVKKNKRTLVVNRVKFDKDTGTASFSRHTILRKVKEEVEYPGILRVYFAKKGRGKLENHKNDAINAVYRLMGLAEAKGITGPVKKNRPTSTRQRKPFTNTGFTASKANMAFKKSQDSMAKVGQIVDALNSTYGLDITMLRSEEIADRYGAEAATYRAFVDNDGKICINLDKASIADPLHESGHLVLAGLSKIDPELYNAIMEQVSLHPEFGKIAMAYQGKSEQAIREEVFVTLFGEHYRRELLRNKDAKEWHAENEGLFKRILNFVKNMFSGIFNTPKIEDYTDDQMYETTLEKLMTAFGDNLIEGKFKHALSQGEMIYGDKINKLKDFLLEQGENSLIGLTKICRA